MRSVAKGYIKVTNAAGGLNPSYNGGDIVMLHDHLNIAGLVGIHPLRGPNEGDFGVRFPPLSDAYDLELRRRTHKVWEAITEDKGHKILHEGVYAFVGGPTYETRAECRMLHMLGADVVGMSTVPEVIAARHSGMRVLAFSLVTNSSVLHAGPKGDDARLEALTVAELEHELSRGKADHHEVLEAGQEAAKIMQTLIVEIVAGLGSA
jgi:purine-nucleoside phosphorylase